MKNVFIKDIDCLIPGFNAKEHGILMDSEEMIAGMKSDSENINDKPFDISFVKNNIGIESLSLTNKTAGFIRKNRNKDIQKSEFYALSQSQENDDLYDLLKLSMKNCLKNIDIKNHKIVGHIHLTGYLFPFLEIKMFNIRKELGIQENIHTLFMNQGCSGLFIVLNYVQKMLESYPEGANFLVTAENNMLPHSHIACLKEAKTNNMNDWLMNCIFSEGVGSMLVGSLAENEQGTSKVLYSVDDIETEIIEHDWRVTYKMNSDEKMYRVVIRAKEVKETYLKGVRKNLVKSIKKCGGLDNMYGICLHESNPKLINILKTEYNLPEKVVPTISREIGSLGAVSSFSLLNILNNKLLNEFDSQKTKIGMALLGEVGGEILAGNMILTAKNNNI